MPLHGPQKRNRSAHIVLVIFKRLFHGLPHSLQPGEMNDGFGPEAPEGPFQPLRIPYITRADLEVGTRKLPNPPQRFRGTVRIIVQDKGFVACAQELQKGMAPDVTCTAGDQNSHFMPTIHFTAPIPIWQTALPYNETSLLTVYYPDEAGKL